METKIIETTNQLNWGKFLLGRFDTEWRIRSSVSAAQREEDRKRLAEVGLESPFLQMPLLREIGWGPDHLWVLDLQTGEGAYFFPHPSRNAKHELNKHKIWVCPMFEPFLQWVYQQDLRDLQALPAMIELDCEFSMRGYRRTGEG